MPRKNRFIKISGDMLNNKVLLEWIRVISKNYFVVICVGGGTQINKAFKKAGLPINTFGPLGRETKNLKERQLARNILEINQARIQDRLDAIGIRVNVVMPIMDIGTVLCHVNGDQYILAAYHGFDELYVITKDQRVEEKRKFFAPYPKIIVMGLKSFIHLDN